MSKVYLGDSVYADFDGFMICLTTENGEGPSDTIYLEPEVMLALIQYAESLKSSEPGEMDATDRKMRAIRNVRASQQRGDGI